MKYPKKGKTKRHLSKKGKPGSKAWLILHTINLTVNDA